MKVSQHWVYVSRGQIIVPTQADTSSGWMDAEPVRLLNPDDVEALREVVLSKLRLGNPVREGYFRDDFPTPVVLKYTEARTWKSFSKSTVWVGWEVEPSRCTISYIADMSAAGVAGSEPQFLQEYPATVDENAFAHAVVEHILNNSR